MNNQPLVCICIPNYNNEKTISETLDSLVNQTYKNIIIKIFIITIIATFFLLCAFLKINEQNFDKLFLYATKYIVRRKKFKYERCLK